MQSLVDKTKYIGVAQLATSELQVLLFDWVEKFITIKYLIIISVELVAFQLD